MKKLVFLAAGLFFSFSASAQEFGEIEGFLIGKLEINASLSFLAPEYEYGKFDLREVDFSRNEAKREVNITAIMEEERREKKRHLVQMEGPLPDLSKGEKNVIEITNRFQMHNRGSNYDPYTGEKKIPAYQEMRAGLFNGYYSPNVGGRYYSPYSHSSFLR